MLNVSDYLIESENASLDSLPNKYITGDVWKIKDEEDGLACASFVKPNNLKSGKLSFNVLFQDMCGGRYLRFVSKEDAEKFIYFLCNSTQFTTKKPGSFRLVKDITPKTIVRIDDDRLGIPVYIAEDSLTWLLSHPDTKVPQFIQDRMKEETVKTQSYLDKKQQEKEKDDGITLKNEMLKTAINNYPFTMTQPGRYSDQTDYYTKEDVKVTMQFPVYSNGKADLGYIAEIIFPDPPTKLRNVEWTTLGDLIHQKYPQRSYSGGSVKIHTKSYPLGFIRNFSWSIASDQEKVNESFKNYLDGLMKIYFDFTNIEDFE